MIIPDLSRPHLIRSARLRANRSGVVVARAPSVSASCARKPTGTNRGNLRGTHRSVVGSDIVWRANLWFSTDAVTSPGRSLAQSAPAVVATAAAANAASLTRFLFRVFEWEQEGCVVYRRLAARRTRPCLHV